MTVTDGGAAKNAGLQKYDVITKIGNKNVQDVSSLRTALYKYKVGQSVKVTYYRDGKAHTKSVKLTESSSSSSDDSSDSDQQDNSNQGQQSPDEDQDDGDEAGY